MKEIKKVKKVKSENSSSNKVKEEHLNTCHVTLSRTFNLGNFNSIKVNIGVSCNFEPNETIKKATKRVFNELKEEYDEILEVMKNEENIEDEEE